MALKKWLILLIVYSIPAMVASGQGRKINFLEYSLPNGLKVILHRDISVPVVAVTVLYHVGSKNEVPGRRGFAHFFEHLMFEGSVNIARGQFMKYVTDAGGTLNANTSQDRTFYYEVLPSNQLALGLWLESERMMHARIDSAGVNTQRKVVKEEKRMRFDNQPYGSVFAQVLKRAFHHTPYGYPPIGTMADINKATLGEFISFYKTYYVPNNAVLSIAGDINLDSTKKMISSWFGPIQAGKIPIIRPVVKPEPLTDAEKKAVIRDNIRLPAVIEAYRMPREGSTDYYAARILSVILSGGPSSRLNRELVDSTQQAAYVGTDPYFNENAGLLINIALANLGVSPDTLQKMMDGQVDSLKSSLVSKMEYTKVMNQIETAFVTGNSTMLGIAESLANYLVYFGNANLINTELERYHQVTREKIRAVARKYLNADNRVVLYYVPENGLSH
ncbi:MAG TPA: pitrilysin family protein [Chitinophagaceae bacterium]|nr:pitrilysin family protein [Chitinophagaceae bacterium]